MQVHAGLPVGCLEVADLKHLGTGGVPGMVEGMGFVGTDMLGRFVFG